MRTTDGNFESSLNSDFVPATSVAGSTHVSGAAPCVEKTTFRMRVVQLFSYVEDDRKQKKSDRARKGKRAPPVPAEEAKPLDRNSEEYSAPKGEEQLQRQEGDECNPSNEDWSQ
jgi:hypothetical protein